MTVQCPTFRHTVGSQMEGYRERMAEKIRDRLREKQMGPGELADKVSASTRTVERWLSGERRPQSRYMKSLAEVLGVDEADLLPDLPPDADALERIEAKLDRLLLAAGLPVDFEQVSGELEDELAAARPPSETSERRNGERGRGSASR